MITLEAIDQNNFKAVIGLELKAEQKGFLQTNEYSIAQSYVYPEFRPMAICHDGVPVGFLLWCIDTDEDTFWIYRLMIDRMHQHKGYGTEALRAVMDYGFRECGLAEMVVENCRREIIIDNNLLLDGLYKIYKKNC